MATDGRISSMIRDLEPDESNIFETSKPSGGSTSGYITRAVSLNGIANAVLNEMEYTTDLETEAKQVIPAINEIYTKGGKDSVLFTPQELTEEQKAQARQNIGASGGSDVTMQDNTKGGVDLTVGGVTRTLINKSDITFAENKSGGLDLSIYNTSATLARQSDLDDLRAEVENKTLRFVDQQEEGMNTLPEGALIESLLTLDGKSEQKTYRGYNGFASSNAQTITKNGITISVGEDGIYKFSGKSTAYTEIEFLLKNSFIMPTSLGAGGKGVFYICSRTGVTLPSGALASFYNENSLIDNWSMLTMPRMSSTYTAMSGKTITRIVFVIPEGITIPEGFEVAYMCVNDGIEDHEFEQYVGGIPSPNPDYPQEMGGYVEEINFKVSSKNLSPKKSMTTTSSGNINSGSGTLGSVEEGKSYTLSFINLTGATTYSDLRILTDTSSQISQKRFNLRANARTTVKFTANNTGEVVINAGMTSTYASMKVFDDIQLEFGSTATPYVPYKEPIAHAITPPFPLKKIRGTSDYCDVTRGEWIRYFDLRRLSSEENWTSHAISGSDTKRYKYTVLDLKQFQTALPDIMSNYFTAITSLEAQTGDYIGIYIGNYAVEVCVTQQTVEEFKQWLEETEVYLLAPLIKPVIEPIETEDLFYLRSLQNLPAENILTITDQNGEDCSYLMKYLVQRGATTP